MEKEYEEKKQQLDERYQARKQRYDERFKTVASTSAPSVEAKVEEEVIEEAKEEIPEEIEEAIKPEVQAPVEEDVLEPILTTIEGIGRGRARKLNEAGINTIGDLAGAMAVDIGKIVSVPIPTASEWIKKATEIST